MHKHNRIGSIQLWPDSLEGKKKPNKTVSHIHPVHHSMSEHILILFCYFRSAFSLNFGRFLE